MQQLKTRFLRFLKKIRGVAYFRSSLFSGIYSIRNRYSCLDVSRHFFVSNEDSDTVAEALVIMRRFCSSWKPRYFLSDQSSVEARSIITALPGLQKGEQECEVVLCTVHVMRTWINKIYKSETRSKMIQAMHKRTKIGCEMLVQKSINESALSAIKRYISRYYLKNTHQWALWACQHLCYFCK